MTRFSWLLVCFLAVSSVLAADEICKSAALDGILEVGCWGYKECVNEILNTHLCTNGTVLHKETRTCVRKGTSHSECDNESICAGEPDGMYADKVDGCKSYFRCYGTINIGQFYCPASLVFSDEIQSCDFPGNVVQPCGRLPVPTPTTA